MDAAGLGNNNLDDFHLDIFSQQLRINQLYTQITFCFPLQDDSSTSDIVDILAQGVKRLSVGFPWLAGKIVLDHGTFKIKPFEDTLRLLTKDCRNDPLVVTWDALLQADFPFSMLDESIFAARETLAVADLSEIPNQELPAFLIQAAFITGGLLLTCSAQHGAMDMTGQGQVMYLLAKACRGEPFTSSELLVGNMDRKGIVELLEDDTPGPTLNHQVLKNTNLDGSGPPAKAASQVPQCTWAYFTFPAPSLVTLKALAIETLPSGSAFVSTDDVLSTFVWQAITRVRLSRLENHSTLNSALIRNVDARSYLCIPSKYPGFMTSSTVTTSAINALVREPLGSIAAQLRSALDPASIRYTMRTSATIQSGHKAAQNSGLPVTSVPELDIKLSSWAKEDCYNFDFGFGSGIGKPEAVRRPRFAIGAREGLVYFLPRSPDGGIAVGICLRDDDLERLRGDKEFAKFGSYVG